MFKLGKDKWSPVRNANYDRVVLIVKRYLDESRIPGCTCERCVNGIIALALNYLPPHYYIDVDRETEVGSPWVMVESAVREAAEISLEQQGRSCGRRDASH